MSEKEYAIIVKNLGKKYKKGLLKGSFAMHDQLEQLLRKPVQSLSSLFPHKSVRDADPPTENGYFWALRGVSFEIRHGEVVGIIGHNGAGKSVLLKILSQITKPSEGYAEIRGTCSSMLEVDSGFHPELTGRENVFMSGAILGMKKHYIEEKYDEIVELSELDGFMDTPVKRYSSGMRVRLAFAVAAQLQPDILIMDEILAVGDKSFHKKSVRELERLRKSGQTILIVSHNMKTIRALCDRVMWFDHGQLELQGKPEEVLSDYVIKKSSLTVEE